MSNRELVLGNHKVGIFVSSSEGGFDGAGDDIEDNLSASVSVSEELARSAFDASEAAIELGANQIRLPAPETLEWPHKSINDVALGEIDQTALKQKGEMVVEASCMWFEIHYPGAGTIQTHDFEILDLEQVAG